jgi:Na+/proline symporter
LVNAGVFFVDSLHLILERFHLFHKVIGIHVGIVVFDDFVNVVDSFNDSFLVLIVLIVYIPFGSFIQPLFDDLLQILAKLLHIIVVMFEVIIQACESALDLGQFLKDLV